MDHVEKTKKEYKKFKKPRDLRYIYQNESDKLCFQHDMAYGDFEDLTRRAVSDKNCVMKHLTLLSIKNVMDIFFSYLGFLSQTFTNHTTAEEGGGHSINSSLPHSPAS